jgi:hypothetical protein
MEAIFSVKPSELNDDLLKQIKSFAFNDEDVITIVINTGKDAISFTENKEEFIRRIQSRINEYHALHKYSEEDLSSFSVVNEPEP